MQLSKPLSVACVTMSSMDAAQTPTAYELSSALFDTADRSMWFRVRSLVIPDLAWPRPPQPLHVLDVHFEILGSPRWKGLRVPTPRSVDPQPWGKLPMATAADWADSFRLWMEEQIAMGCDRWALKDSDGVVEYFALEARGLRRDKTAECYRQS